MNTEHDTLIYDKDFKSMRSSNRKSGLLGGV